MIRKMFNLLKSERKIIIYISLFMFINFIFNYSDFINNYINKYLDLKKISILEVLAILLFVLIITFLIYILYKYPDQRISKNIIRILTGQGSGIEIIFVFIFSLIFLSWSGDYFKEGRILNGILSLEALFLLALLYLNSISKKYENNKPRKNIDPQPSKVLIMALSKLNGNKVEIINALKDRIDKIDIKQDKLTNNDRYINWALPLELIRFNKDTLEKAFFLVSNESNEERIDFEELVNLLKKKIKREFKLEFSNVLDFNDYADVLSGIEYCIKNVLREGYTDMDIMINISGGTSAVTSALIIAAIQDGRQVAYFTQNSPSELKAFDVSYKDVQRATKDMLSD